MAKKKQAQDFQLAVHPATSLLREVIDQSNEFAKNVGSELDVNETDFAAMEHLITNGPMSAGELAKAVGISPGSATIMIDRLVAVGHVTRESNPKDRRGVVVAPNPESVAQAWKHIGPLVMASEKALAKFSPSERKAIENYLATMLAVYQKSPK
jgi:DNA-binding MarR family transcriptional regulator